MDCPVCGEKLNTDLCALCGWDGSAEREMHPTLRPAGGGASLAKRRRDWQTAHASAAQGRPPKEAKPSAREAKEPPKSAPFPGPVTAAPPPPAGSRADPAVQKAALLRARRKRQLVPAIASVVFFVVICVLGAGGLMGSPVLVVPLVFAFWASVLFCIFRGRKEYKQALAALDAQTRQYGRSEPKA